MDVPGLTAERAPLLDIYITSMCSPSCVFGLLSLEMSNHLPTFCNLPSSRGHYLANEKETALFRKINARTLKLFRHRVIQENLECVFVEVNLNLANNLLIVKLKKPRFPGAAKILQSKKKIKEVIGYQCIT